MTRLPAAALVMLALCLPAHAQDSWDLATCRAVAQAGHLCTPEHLDADLAVLTAQQVASYKDPEYRARYIQIRRDLHIADAETLPDPRIDPTMSRFLHSMAETGMVESSEAVKRASAAAKAAEQNLADFMTCRSDNYRSLGFKWFEERKRAARMVKEEKKIDREELDWFGFYGADHACTPEHWAEDWAILIARDTTHARDPKWQKNELKRQTKSHVLNPVPLPDPTAA